MKAYTAGLRESRVPTVRAEVDLGALRQNLRAVRAAAGGVPVLGVVKANAYGHGVELVAPVLAAEGVRAFAVANVSEGIALRALGIDGAVLVFTPPLPQELPAYVAYGLDVAVTSPVVAEAVLAHPGPFRVHVEVDTGMHRLGLSPAETPDVVRRLQAAPHVEIVALWTHLATADEDDLAFSREQLACLEAVLAATGGLLPVHVANSGALAQLPEAVRQRALVRPGGLLYGIPATEIVAARVPVRPVMRLVSRVVHVQTVPAGESVSYGRTWRAAQPTRIATVAAGYADGLPRQLSNRGRAGVRGRLVPYAGAVCMDLLMLDLGPPDGPLGDVEPGEEVVLLGPGGPPALDLAEAAGTVTYALTAGLTARVVRVATEAAPGAGARNFRAPPDLSSV